MTARPETAAERKEARQAHAAAQQPAPSRTTWDSKPRPGDRPAQLAERERQRVEHLVLDRERPTPKGRAKRRAPVTLKDDGVDQALQAASCSADWWMERFDARRTDVRPAEPAAAPAG